jgi:lysophospholipase L1-like esterase
MVAADPPAGAPSRPGSGNLAPQAVQPSARTDRNSRIAHQQLLEKAHKGRIGIYFVGDSITRRWGATDYPEFLANWKRNFHGWNAANFGWGGDTIQNILWRLQNGELEGVHPRIFVVMAGTNNLGARRITGGEDAQVARVSTGLKAILDLCQRECPQAVIILMGITPRNDRMELMPIISKINERIAGLADGKKIRFLNLNAQLADHAGVLRAGMSPDLLHLSAKAYQVWADALKPIFTEVLGPPGKVDLAPPATGDPSAARR